MWKLTGAFLLEIGKAPCQRVQWPSGAAFARKNTDTKRSLDWPIGQGYSQKRHHVNARQTYWHHSLQMCHFSCHHVGRVVAIIVLRSTKWRISFSFQIWDIKSEKCITELEFSPKSFEITALAHPPAYKDKIIFGSRQGTLQVSFSSILVFYLWTLLRCTVSNKF